MRALPASGPILLLLLLLSAALPGCATGVPVAAALVVEGASVAVFGRGVVDIAVSAISGRDCSIVRLDRGTTYCAPVDKPVPARFCTRSLAAVDCWDPSIVAVISRRGLNDTPPLSSDQQHYQAARWPKALTSE